MSTITSSGTKIEVITIDLESTNDDPVVFTNAVQQITIKCRTSAAILVKDGNNATPYYTIPAGGSLTLSVSALGSNVWLRSATGSVTAEIIGIY